MWPLPNQHPSSHWAQQPHGYALMPSIVDYANYHHYHRLLRQKQQSRSKDRPRIFKGQIYTAPNHVMGSGDLRKNLPQLDADGFNKLLLSAGDIVLERYPTNTPRWRTMPEVVAEEMKAAFLGLSQCREVLRCSENPEWTREVLILLLARAVNNRRALELRKLKIVASSVPRIVTAGAEGKG